MNYVFQNDPAEYPHTSTAFDGYLWAVRINADTTCIVDDDTLAAYADQNGQNVTIWSFPESV